MPTISKQTTRPVRSNGQEVVTGGLLASAVSVADIQDDFVNFVLYGQNRVGKTTLACQLPKPLLLISFEPGNTGGAASVKKMPGIKFIRITSKGQAIALARELSAAGGGVCDLPDYRGKKYVTHVLDTCTSLQDVILKELMGLDETPIQLNWGSVPEDFYRERSEQAKEVIRLYRDIPVHTVFVAQERDHNPPKQERNKLIRGPQSESLFGADLGAATVKWMHDACDYVGQLYIDKETVIKTYKTKGLDGKDEVTEQEEETGRLIRKLRTLFHPNYYAGFRSATPEAVPEHILNPTWDKIAAVIRGEKIKDARYPK